MNQTSRDGFSSRFGIFAAVIGSAIGLGNIWRFPYMVGENGGAAFLIVYCAFVLIIGIPAMLSEFIIGRRGQGNSYRSFKQLAPQKPWYWIGLVGIFAAFIILTFYSVITGWTLEYVAIALKDVFSSSTVVQDPAQVFEHFHTQALKPLIWQIVTMLISAIVIMLGVRKGIESSAKILMPLLFICLAILAVKTLTLPGSVEGLRFLFSPDFSKINSGVILKALGQAVFSLSVGMGCLITYGSYIRKDVNMSRTAFSVAIADLLIAVLAGIVIFPALFSFGMAPEQGPGLVFVVFPGIFQQMIGGVYFALLFFMLVAIAGITSIISLLEVIVVYFVEEFKLKRVFATLVAATLACGLGAFSTLSFGPLKHVKIFNQSIFDNSDFLASNILLPLGAFFVVVFLGWFYDINQIKDELGNQGTLKMRLFPVFMFIIRYVAPIAILLVFLKGLNIF
ncbi:MAG: sodium-dependent transporter [Bacteroidales bacterium]|nr:sodium-dependent transporter [Bacteroidales bacterium]